MAPRVGLRARLRYWFDNTMSKGTVSLIGWLAFVTLAMIVGISTALSYVEPAKDGVAPGAIGVLWQTFVTTFSLAVPVGENSLAVLALWFVLGVGGIFVVSALVGLLTSGLNQRLEQLRKGRSLV